MTREIVVQDEIKPDLDVSARDHGLEYLRPDGTRRVHPIGRTTLSEAFGRAQDHAEEGESFLQVVTL